jgi:hypothetical protein
VVGTTPTSIFVTAGNIPVGVPDPPAPAVLAFAGTSGPRERAAFTVALPDKARVRISVYGPTGRRVAVLCDGELPAGTTRFPLEARGLNSGVWFARAEIATPHGNRNPHGARTALALTRDRCPSPNPSSCAGSAPGRMASLRTSCRRRAAFHRAPGTRRAS